MGPGHPERHKVGTRPSLELIVSSEVPLQFFWGGGGGEGTAFTNTGDCLCCLITRSLQLAFGSLLTTKTAALLHTGTGGVALGETPLGTATEDKPDSPPVRISHV